MQRMTHLLVAALAVWLPAHGLWAAQPYTIVDTGQVHCYDNRAEIAGPKPGQAFDGQDAQYGGAAPRYKDNGDGKLTPDEYRPLRPGGPGMRGEGTRPGGAQAGEGPRSARQRPPSE
jgi:hypothetical protein